MYSMTGYGKGVASECGKTITVEIKTVNHRYLDLGIKMPRNFLFLEDAVKKSIGAAISRGHADVYLTYEQDVKSDGAYTVDLELARGYLAAARELVDKIGIEDDITLTSLVKVQDIIKREQPLEDEELLMRLTLTALADALEKLKDMRYREGETLKADINDKLCKIELLLEGITERAPLVVAEYKAGIEARIAEVLEPSKIDMQRLATEVALFADHCAIDEEITRLSAHITHMRELLEANEPVGRKMEFLVQEFNRETNTIGSKANDMTITQSVLAIKNEIEKIREQSANIE